tara:strand:- start:4318 stop:5079 length:762 start_codon:yes stop_codon:yes gene_type:complete
MSDKPYKRVLLKLSGEALMGNNEYGLSQKVVKRIAKDIKTVSDMGVQICIVIGAGNIFRGVSGASKGIDRATADYMGMLATVINCLAMQSALEEEGLYCRTQSAIPMSTVCEPYIRRRALRHMEKGRVVIFAAGTGNPFFTTDTAAALRATEMNCDALFKGTKVDGVYTADPVLDPTAERYSELSYMKVLTDDLRVMDASAISVAKDNKIPVIVFSINTEGSFAEVVQKRGDYTLVIETPTGDTLKPKEVKNG